MTYTPDDDDLKVSNPLPPAGTEGPLAHAGTGYGLTGLRERAALVDGTLTAAPDDGRWKVLLRLRPAQAHAGTRITRPAGQSAHDR